ncbi:MAG: acyl-ACP--UDP-N-acetylglucosamine O-acyltransferase [Opitutales bacterium]
MKIHPTAVIEEGAEFHEDVEVGAYAFIGARVKIARGVRIHHHATIDGATTIGANCEFFPYACIGLKTQDLKYTGGFPGLIVGEGNVFREFSTVHTATKEGDYTRIGDGNFFLGYSHIAHDCQIGNGVIVSNNGGLAGHVVVDDKAVIGGFAGVHQFCRLGKHAMLGAYSKLIHDVPPFLIADGNPAVVRSINRVGLERSGYGEEGMERIKQIYRIFYREGLNRAQALEKLSRRADADAAETQAFLRFATDSKRGFAPGYSHIRDEMNANGKQSG